MAFANRAPEKWGMVSLYTGDGKGKTTAALGSAIRAAAKGKRVAIVYFDKGGDSHYSERDFVKQVSGAMPFTLEVHPTGLDRIDPVTGRFRFGVIPEDIEEAKRGLGIVERLFASGECSVIVMDEINSTTALGMIEEQAVLDLLAKKPTELELIMTGRNAPQSFLERADLVTEMKLVKHYFYQGVGAREGIDY